ncbi:MAG: hypothetical protein ACI92B_001489 [Marinobacter maritimus]|jgi:hypothetical protein
MAQMKVSLSIGYPGAEHHDVIEVEDDELSACKTDDERQKLLAEYWKEWSGDFIDGYYDLINEDGE